MTADTRWAQSPFFRRRSANQGSLVSWALASALVILISNVGWAQNPQQIVTIGPPEKNNAYYFDQAAQIAAWWSSDPRPEIRVVLEESITGGQYDSNNTLIPGSYTVDYYLYQVVVGVEIVAWDTSGRPEAVWVTFAPGGPFDSRQPQGGPSASGPTWQAHGGWSNTRNDSGEWDLVVTLHPNGIATGRWGGSHNAFTGTWSGTTVRWIDGKYEVTCTLPGSAGGQIRIHYDVPSEGYSGDWESH